MTVMALFHICTILSICIVDLLDDVGAVTVAMAGMLLVHFYAIVL
jgi:hypothetical protein